MDAYGSSNLIKANISSGSICGLPGNSSDRCEEPERTVQSLAQYPYQPIKTGEKNEHETNP
jgi:hypothetical protein